MQTWNIGNTTVRNPRRIAQALGLFASAMGGRLFDRSAQREFQDLMIAEGLVEARAGATEKRDYESGARKFASCFKQLGFVTDWAKGREWTLTPVGRALLAHPELEETLFLRQLLKYQLPSPLEPVHGLRLRPFRLLLRFLAAAHDRGLVGLTKEELGLFVITTLTEDDQVFQAAMGDIVALRARVEAERGLVARRRVAGEQLMAMAAQLGLVPGTLADYADSNSRYALMSGLLTTRDNKLAVLASRRPLIDLLLADGTTLLPDANYLDQFYSPTLPVLPTDDAVFLQDEIRRLEADVRHLSRQLAVAVELPAPPADTTLQALQAYEQRLRQARLGLREQDFADDHYRRRPLDHLNEIDEVLQRVTGRGGDLIGGQAYRPALLEWAIWRLFLVINHLAGPIAATHGFRLDEDLNPVHHAVGGAADLTLEFADFILVTEMTLTTGSRQFAAEGEPVTRHVYQVIRQQAEPPRPVYGLLIAPAIDPNTVDLYHGARYWANWQTPIPTPVVALELADVRALIARLKDMVITPADVQRLLEEITALQSVHPNGPAWQQAAQQAFRNWLAGLNIRRPDVS